MVLKGTNLERVYKFGGPSPYFWERIIQILFTSSLVFLVNTIYIFVISVGSAFCFNLNDKTVTTLYLIAIKKILIWKFLKFK